MTNLPPPVPDTAPQNAEVTGGSLVKAAWRALRADKELMSLPILGAVSTVLAIAPLAVVFFLSGIKDGVAGYALLAVEMFIASTVGTFFAVALAAGANDRMNGSDPTVRSALGVAWARKSAVLQWAAIGTLVGVVLRIIEDKLSWVGKFIGALGGLAWSIATYFAIPLIATEDVNGWEAVQRSGRVMRERWGKAVRVEVRLLVAWLAIVIGVVAAGVGAIVLAEAGLPVAGGALIVLAVVAAVVAALLLNAVAAYSRVALFRYATGLPVPGFDSAVLHTAVKTKN